MSAVHAIATRPLRVLVVDDEELARAAPARAWSPNAPSRAPIVVGEAANAAQALVWLATQRVRPAAARHPDARPRRHPARRRAAPAQSPAPAVVFVTAHAEHALKAFDLEAVDYLTKPVRARAPAGGAAARRAAPRRAAAGAAPRRPRKRAGDRRQRPRPRGPRAGGRGAVPEGRAEVRDAAHRRAHLRARRLAGRARAAPRRRASCACTATRWSRARAVRALERRAIAGEGDEEAARAGRSASRRSTSGSRCRGARSRRCARRWSPPGASARSRRRARQRSATQRATRRRRNGDNRGHGRATSWSSDVSVVIARRSSCWSLLVCIASAGCGATRCGDAVALAPTRGAGSRPAALPRGRARIGSAAERCRAVDARGEPRRRRDAPAATSVDATSPCSMRCRAASLRRRARTVPAPLGVDRGRVADAQRARRGRPRRAAASASRRRSARRWRGSAADRRSAGLRLGLSRLRRGAARQRRQLPLIERAVGTARSGNAEPWLAVAREARAARRRRRSTRRCTTSPLRGARPGCGPVAASC